MYEIAIDPRNPWSVFDELDSLQADVNELIQQQNRARQENRFRMAYPALNVWASPDGLLIDAEIPGVNPQAVDITVKGDALTIKGSIPPVELQDGEVFHRRERPSGTFVRSLQLPFRADSGKVSASCRNGVLRLSIPRSEEDKAQKIEIQTD